MSGRAREEPEQDGPVLRCWNCDKPLHEMPRPVSRHEYCGHCAEPVHCCRMCSRFAPARPDQCLEDRAEPPTDKTAANFCDYFLLREPSSSSAVAGSDARSRLDALFGADDEGEPGAAGSGDRDDRQERARSRLDQLFGGGTDDA